MDMPMSRLGPEGKPGDYTVIQPAIVILTIKNICNKLSASPNILSINNKR